MIHIFSEQFSMGGSKCYVTFALSCPSYMELIIIGNTIILNWRNLKPIYWTLALLQKHETVDVVQLPKTVVGSNLLSQRSWQNEMSHSGA